MGRRKQGASPQKDLGLIEYRKRRAPSSLPPIPLEDLPAWLQQEPQERSVVKKKRKVKATQDGALIPMPSVDNAVLLLGMFDMAAASSAQGSGCATLQLSSEAVPGSNSVVQTLLAGSADGGEDEDVPCTIVVCGVVCVDAPVYLF